MYSLDINFLNDPNRPPINGASGGKGPDNRPKPSGKSMAPLVAGVVVGLLLPGLVGGLWFFLQQQNAKLQERQAALDTELARLQVGQQRINQLNAQITQVNSETQALATVFNQIKPWSAMLQDVRERIPPGAQIQSIEQVPVTASTAPAPAASPSPNAAATSTPTPAMQLKISGRARSFDDVNYFLLTLKRSSFLKSDETQLVGAELIKNPNKVQVNTPESRTQSGATVTYELPKVVEYTIQTSVSDVPASELLRELDRKGAVGLVTRIRTLQNQGVIKP